MIQAISIIRAVEPMWLVAKYWRVKACILSSVNLLSQRRKLRSREVGPRLVAGPQQGWEWTQPEFLPPAPPQPLKSPEASAPDPFKSSPMRSPRKFHLERVMGDSVLS